MTKWHPAKAPQTASGTCRNLKPGLMALRVLGCSTKACEEEPEKRNANFRASQERGMGCFVLSFALPAKQKRVRKEQQVSKG